MKKIYAVLFSFSLFLFFFAAPAAAQVTGTIVDSTAQAIPFCNVLLVKASDSTMVTATTTDTTGHFTLEKKDSGTFCVRVRYAGCRDYFSAPFELSAAQPQFNAGTITLLPDPKILKDVVITAAKPFVEQKIDRTVYNIENSVISSGNNALEVLRKLPGVTVDNNEQIQVRGKAGVQIMIDGRMSNLSGQDISAYLKTIDASQIEKIEVITNPSSKYDAAGNAVINIMLKKDKRMGLNGQVSLAHNQGFYGITNGNIRANYRLKHSNFFVTYGHGDGHYYQSTGRTTYFGNHETPSAVQEVRQRYQNHFTWDYLRTGADFFIGDNHTLGFVLEGNNGANYQGRSYSSLFYNNASTPDSSLNTITRQTNMTKWRAASMDYLWKIDTAGSTLDASVYYSPFSIVTTRNNLNTPSDYVTGTSPNASLQKMRLPTTIDITVGQVNYVHPVGEKQKFESGVKGSFVSTNNDAKYWNVVNGVDVNDTLMSNLFLYEENIYAGYANYMRQLSKKIDVQLGLRGEQTESRGNQVTTQTTFNRSYFNLFPSAYFNWKVDSSNTLNLSYSRRIDRPDYGDLNPFRFYQNPYSYEVGNPYLRPQLNHHVELTHTYKDALSLTVGYLYMSDVFAYVPSVIESSGTFFTRVENFSTYQCWNIQGTFAKPLAQWFTTMTTVNVFHDDYRSPLAGSNFNSKGWTWLIYSLNTFTISKSLSAEVSFFYRSMNRNAVLREQQFGQLDAGIRYNFADGRGTLALNVEDLLRTSYINSTASYPGIYNEFSGRGDSRRARLSASWRFGKSQYQRNERRNGGEDEKNRAGS